MIYEGSKYTYKEINVVKGILQAVWSSKLRLSIKDRLQLAYMAIKGELIGGIVIKKEFK